MEKKRLFKIMGKSPRREVMELAREIEKNYTVVMVKKPAKTLVMLKMEEPVARSEYYLGELLACEAMVRIGAHRGMAVTAGDDFEKTLAMATVDAAYNAGVPEVGWLGERLAALEITVNREEQRDFARNSQSKVDFRVMEGES
jgi:alpha-D-ribose 1-methylphosphonate 5-triphosphate synthase subunit PhnG